MNKGETNEIALIVSSVFIIVTVVFVMVFFMSARINVRLDFPETSSQIGSYSMLQNIISQNCLGTDISGVLNRTKMDSAAGKELNCLRNPSFSYYVKIEQGETLWEYSDVYNSNVKFFDEPSYRFSLPVAIYSGGNITAAKITLLTSYKNKELLVFVRDCAEEAIIAGECERQFLKGKIDAIKFTFGDNLVCRDDKIKACLRANAEFDTGEIVYSRSDSAESVRYINIEKQGDILVASS